MASSGTIATGGGGGVSLQADLPGLASLVLTMGRSGLKRLAQAGVDVHTILCMSEIAEKCPASIEYRREISDCRQAQRNETQWLYKVVELGAGTNFVADELLKKRAGENVVALLSAVLSVMDEKPCDILLLKLFEAVGADLDSTPGFAQLRSLRKSLTSLAKKTQFKDRVYQYHTFLMQLPDLDNAMSEEYAHAHHGIPNEETAVKVILALSRLIQDDPTYVLEYQGLLGSAWVITYARHVLGLPVCVLSSPSNAVPVSGDYQNSRVFVHIYGSTRECKLLTRGKLQEFFLTSSIAVEGCNGWQIDISRVDVLDSCIPRSDRLRKVCGVIARSLANDYTEMLANAFVSSSRPLDLHDIGLNKYIVYCLPQIQRRAQKVLALLGFEKNTNAEMRRRAWVDYFKIHSYGRPGLEKYHLMPCRKWEEEIVGHLNTSESRQTWWDAGGGRYLDIIFSLVQAASWLAFTDWDQNVQLLSTGFLESTKAQRSHSSFFEIFGDSMFTTLERDGRHHPSWTINSLGRYSAGLILGLDEWRRAESFSVSLAVHQQGIVFTHNLEVQQRLDWNGCFLHVLRGTIQAHGEEKTSIISIGKTTNLECLERQNKELPFQPTNMFPDMSVKNNVEVHAKEICVDFRVSTNNEVLGIRAPAPNESVGKSYVTDPCTHGYHNEFSETDHGFASITQGFSLSRLYSYSSQYSRGPRVWLQAVDQNPVGQWLACQTLVETLIKPLYILQRDCCIGCTLQRYNDGMRADLAARITDIYIIHGRLKGE